MLNHVQLWDVVTWNTVSSWMKSMRVNTHYLHGPPSGHRVQAECHHALRRTSAAPQSLRQKEAQVIQLKGHLGCSLHVHFIDDEFSANVN